MPVSANSQRELNQSLVAASLAMPSLKKTDRNSFGGYNFVSIDDFHEYVAKVALDHGITWKMRETGHALLPGRDKDAILFEYAFDVCHGDEEYKDFANFSVPHPLQGAQTSGSAASYAIKLFLRTTFHVVTGEADADATDSSALVGLGTKPMAPGAFVQVPASVVKNRTPMPIGEVRDAAWVSKFLELVRGSIELASSEEDLIEFWENNIEGIEALKASDAGAYQQVVGAFKGRKGELANG